MKFRTMNWIDVWIDEPYMNILLYQNLETRHIIEKLDILTDKNKFIIDTFVIGLFYKYNDVLISKHGVKGYLQGLYNLLSWYNYVKSDTLIIKKSWMNMTNKKAILSY